MILGKSFIKNCQSIMNQKTSQLFILPYAGGDYNSFKQLVSNLDSSIEAFVIEYPGRGKRKKEPQANTFLELIDDAIDSINSLRDDALSFAILGYSMGGVIAYEILKRKDLAGEADRLFIASSMSPKDRYELFVSAGEINDEKIMNRLELLGGIDKRILENERFSKVFLKPIIEDFRLFSQYCFEGQKEKLNINATILYSKQDIETQEVEHWEELLNGKIDYYCFDGGHFFINTNYMTMAKIINDYLQVRTK